MEITPPPYSPGLHLLATMQVPDTVKLLDANAFVAATAAILDRYALEQIGQVVHRFDNDSFTAAVCLKESHVCIHTWPEYHQLTLDVYLCNYLQDNAHKVRAVMQDYIRYFEASDCKLTEVER